MSDNDDKHSQHDPRMSGAKEEPLVERAARLLKERAPDARNAKTSLAQTDNRRLEEALPAPTIGRQEGDDIATVEDSRGEQISRTVAIDSAFVRRNHVFLPGNTGTQTAEELRQIKQSLLHSMFYGTGRSGKNTNLVMVTSSRPNEGKTFISLNVALSLAAERDLSVLLIDLDHTNQGITKSLGIEEDRGFINLVEDPSLKFSDVILRTNIDGFSIIPSGPTHPLALELFGSERMIRLLDELSGRYSDRIIMFDAPPVLATADASVLAQHMGQVIFVIEANKTGKTTISEAMDLLKHSQNLSLVLNKTRPFFADSDFGAYYQSYGYAKPS